MEHALEREQAAETIRAVEGMRRRTIAAVGRLSPFPLIVFGLAALAAGPFMLIDRNIRRGTGGAFRIGGSGHTSTHTVLSLVALAIATIAAVVITEVHYLRQPVHPAAPKRVRSTGEMIFLAIILIFFGPGVLMFFVVASVNGGWITVGFFGLSIAAIVEGRHTKNNALEFLGMLGALPALVSPLISADYGEGITAGIYAVLFLLGAFVVRVLNRRTA